MATQTEGADVVEVAFSAAFADGQDVVGVPEAPAMQAADSPVLEQVAAIGSSGAAERAEGGHGVDSAPATDAAVAQEDLIAQIGRLRAQLPLVHAICGAECKAAARDFE